MSYDKTNTGILFKNDRKEEGSKQPDYTGTINVDGKELELAAWIRQGPKAKFMSLSVKPKREQAAKTSTPAPARSADVDSDIPW